MSPSDVPSSGSSPAAAALKEADAAAKASPTAGSTVAATQDCPFEGIKIDGSADFQKKTIAALREIEGTKSGKALLADLKKSGKTVTIKETASGNGCEGFNNNALVKADGTPGSGSNSTVMFNPDRKKIGDEAWQTRPPAIGLGHELVHADHAANGTVDTRKVDNDDQPDPADPDKKAQEIKEEVRTAGIPPYDKEPYSENTLRNEWSPKQPSRPYY